MRFRRRARPHEWDSKDIIDAIYYSSRDAICPFAPSFCSCLCFLSRLIFIGCVNNRSFVVLNLDDMQSGGFFFMH
jgi:hypothetical protein